MKILAWGLSLYCVAFLLHLIVWKIRLPQRQTKTLLIIFFSTLVCGLCIFWISDRRLSLGIAVPETFAESLHIGILFISLTLAYMITYSALEADSPSLVMIMTIAQAGPEGLPKEQFYQNMTDEVLIMPRVQDMLRDHLAYLDGSRYKLSAKGVMFARIFIIYRQILNLQRKGG